MIPAQSLPDNNKRLAPQAKQDGNTDGVTDHQLSQSVDLPSAAFKGQSLASALTEDAEAVFRSFRAIRRLVIGRTLGMAAIPPSYVELLNLVRRNPGIRVGEAARTLRLASNTVSTLAGKLSGAGLLERQLDEDDHRMVRFYLTDAAASELSAWRDHRLDLLSQALDELQGDDRALISAAVPALGRLARLIRSNTDKFGNDPG